MLNMNKKISNGNKKIDSDKKGPNIVTINIWQWMTTLSVISSWLKALMGIYIVVCIK